MQVDAIGNPRGELGAREPRPGHQLRLSLDLDVQQGGSGGARGRDRHGAFVAMDIHNGEVLGARPNPSFDPNVFSKGDQAVRLHAPDDQDNGAPLTNRAIQGGYPTGSTFKLITATAGARVGPDHARHALNDPVS